MTNRCATTLEESAELTDWYRCRWEVEIFFDVLKNGCKVEALQLSSIERLERKRDSILSITHKFCPDIEAKLDVDETRQSAPHDSIAWWSIMSTVEVSAESRDLVQIMG